MRTVAQAHAALSSITAALKGNEYLGVESRKRLLVHAEVVRRALDELGGDGSVLHVSGDEMRHALDDRVRRAGQ